MSDSSKKPAGSESGLGFKFTSTGRDDSTTEILKPRLTPAVKRRNAIGIAVVIVLVLAICVYSYLKNPINPLETQHGPAFAPGAQDPAKSE